MSRKVELRNENESDTTIKTNFLLKKSFPKLVLKH